MRARNGERWRQHAKAFILQWTAICFHSLLGIVVVAITFYPILLIVRSRERGFIFHIDDHFSQLPDLFSSIYYPLYLVIASTS